MDGIDILRVRDTSNITETIAAGLAEHAAEVDRDGAFPWDSLDVLHTQGLLGLTARPEDGGANVGLVRAAELVRAAGRGCASTALIFAMQLIHLRASTSPAWPAHLSRRVGRSAVGCGALINALRAEPALGTPARGGMPRTVARRVENGWSITGRKTYATGAAGLAWMLVFAGTDDERPRTGLFLLPTRTPGISLDATWDHLGLRGSGSHDVVFEQAVVPFDHAIDLREPSDWAVRDDVTAAWIGLLLAALYTGVAEAARDWLAGFLRERLPANLGMPLAALPRVQEAMGGIEALLLTNRHIIRSAARDTDAHTPPAAGESALLKTAATENAVRAVQAAVELCGNHALSRANPLERHLRDVLCARVHTPQADSAHIGAGRVALGQAA